MSILSIPECVTKGWSLAVSMFCIPCCQSPGIFIAESIEVLVDNSGLASKALLLLVGKN